MQAPHPPTAKMAHRIQHLGQRRSEGSRFAFFFAGYRVQVTRLATGSGPGAILAPEAPMTDRDQDLGQHDDDDAFIFAALRFDGYAFRDATGFDDHAAFERARDEGPDGLTLEQRFALLFLLQRYLYKWGGERLSRSGPEWRLFRRLFVELAPQDAPERYRVDDYDRRWRELPEARRAAAVERASRAI